MNHRPAAPRVDDRYLSRLRALNLGVASPAPATPEEIVRRLGAVQSQEFALAKWSVGQRAAEADESAVDRALTDGTILRTHVLRPTWHFVRDEDIRWMLELTAPRVRAMMASYDRNLELDAPLYARSNDLIARAVEGGNHHTRKELSEVLEAEGIVATGQRLAHIVMRAELDGIVCSGAVRGKQNSYALVAERAPRARRLERDEALGELATRYFTSHGPATLKDFRWWSSLTATDARRAVGIAGGALQSLVADDRSYWLAASPLPSDPAPSPAHLLQVYDEYVVGYTESRKLLDVAGIVGPLPGGVVSFAHLIVLDGQAVGHWRRRPAGSRLVVEMQFLRRLKRGERPAIEAAVDRYARFLGLPGEMTI